MEHITVKGEKYSAWVACTNPYEINRYELKEAVETLEKYNVNNSVTQLVKNNTEKVERTLKAILNKQQRALTDVNALIPTYVSDTITKTLVTDIRSMLSKVMAYAGMKFLTNPTLVEEAKAELMKQTGGKAVSLVPPEGKPGF